MKDRLTKLQIGNRLRFKGKDGQVIHIERVLLGKQLCWHLHHGKTRITTKELRKMTGYLEMYSKNKQLFGEVVDLGDY